MMETRWGGGGAKEAGGGGGGAPAARGVPADGPEADGLFDFAYTGSGGLIGFYAGVTQGLLDYEVIVPGQTRFGGLSGGALAVTMTTLGLDGPQQLAATVQTMLRCAALPGHCAEPGQIDAALMAQLEGMLDETSAALFSEKVFYWGAEINPADPTEADNRARVLAPYSSKADLLHALSATSYVPCGIGANPYKLFRGRPFIDGGYATAIPWECPPQLAGQPEKRCVTVAVSQVGPLSKGSLLDCPRNFSQPRTGPAYEEVKAADWALPETCEGFTMPDLVQAKGAEICPGCRVQLPDQFDVCKWRSFSKSPPKALKDVVAIYQQGIAEAHAWAVENGFRPKVSFTTSITAAPKAFISQLVGVDAPAEPRHVSMLQKLKPANPLVAWLP
jgi:hypothetical protein